MRYNGDEDEKKRHLHRSAREQTSDELSRARVEVESANVSY